MIQLREELRGLFLPGRTSGVALATTVAATALFSAAILIGQVSRTGFIAVGIAFVVLLAAASWRWPRVVLMVTVLSPILDRYIVAGLLPESIGAAAHVTSEALLAAVAFVIAARGWRDATLLPALRHPTIYALILFVGAGIVAMITNHVPPNVAVAGLAFTLDAALLFVAVRVVGYDFRQTAISAAVFICFVAFAAFIALLQALLDPRLFGLYALQGRYGEVYRLSSFLGDPNTFGALLIVAIPFAILGAVTAHRRGWRVATLVLAVLLLLALWLSFSRGAWLAFVVGGGATIAIIDRRALVTGATLTAVAFAIALSMPRDLLVGSGGGGGHRPDLVDSTLDRVGTVGQGRDLRTLFVLNALQILGDHPLVGVGPGWYGGAAAFNYHTPVYNHYGTNKLFTNPQQRTVDNFWLHILIEGGILGFLALAGAVAVAAVPTLLAARRALGRWRVLLGGIAAAVAVVTMSSITTMTLEANGVAYLFWFLLGLGTLVSAASASTGRVGGLAGEDDRNQSQEG